MSTVYPVFENDQIAVSLVVSPGDSPTIGKAYITLHTERVRHAEMVKTSKLAGLPEHIIIACDLQRLIIRTIAEMRANNAEKKGPP